MVYWQYLSSNPNSASQTESMPVPMLVGIVSWRNQEKERNKEKKCQQVGYLPIISLWWLVSLLKHGTRRNLGEERIRLITTATFLARFPLLQKNLNKVITVVKVILDPNILVRTLTGFEPRVRGILTLNPSPFLFSLRIL